jgi:putative dimethyl sulfoxide reductase chaperone
MMIDGDTALAWSDDAATLALLHDRELGPAVLASLKALGFPANLGMVPHDEQGRQVFDAMRDTLAHMPDAPDTLYMDNLAADFAAVYLTGALDASPFESFWISDEHLLCQESMFEMRALYAAEGLRVPDWRLRPDDHLVFQLHFLARRLERVASGMATNNAQTAAEQWRSLAVFLDHHLLRWLPDFARRVSQRCDSAFYAALALVTDVWCQRLRDVIATHLGEPRPSKDEVEAILRGHATDEVQPEPIRFMPGIGGPSW